MEGVGARLGRSSSRYGTNTVFTGPVRKWKKHWVPIIPPNNTTTNNNTNNTNNSNHHHLNSSSTSTLNGNTATVSHLRLFKWTPLSSIKHNPNSNANNQDTTSTPDHDSPPQLQPPTRKKFKYIPIAVLEEQNKEAEDNSDNEDDVADTETIKSDGREEKPDINDMPIEEDQEGSEGNDTAPGRQDLNESLDLSLGLTSHEEELNSNSNG